MTRRDFTRSALLFFGSQLGLKAIADAEIVKRLGFEPRDTLNLMLNYESAAPLRARLTVVMKPDRHAPDWVETIDLPPRKGPQNGLQVSCPVPFVMEDVWAFRVSIEAVTEKPFRTRLIEFDMREPESSWEAFGFYGPIGQAVVRRKG